MMNSPHRGQWRERLARCGHALIEWLSHLLIVAMLLVGIHLRELLIFFLGEDRRLLFDRVPLTYLFDAGDAALIATFLTYGTYSVFAAYRRPGDGRSR
jgi:hypothetical protein